MKKIILLILSVSVFQLGFAQLKIESGAQWITSGNTAVVLNDLGFINSGTMNAGTGTFKFTGTQNTGITGVNLPVFNILEIAKTNNAKVILSRDINVNASIVFISGLLDLWSSKCVLGSGAYVSGETEANRITAGTGFIEITQNLNGPNNTNPGNLGAFINSNANLGSVTVRRGHQSLTGTGLTSGINRYYSIIPTNNAGLNATLRFKYFDAELNGQNENSLVLYQGINGFAAWNNLSRTSNSTTSNFVEKTGLDNFSYQTLANDNTVAGAVTGLTFTGLRKKTTEIQLNWTSQSETNMSGYLLQRRLDNEIDFSDRAFVASLAPGGNSISPLDYMNVDANAYTGTSYYRLKITDKNNNFSYSNVISVAGKQKGVKGGGNGNGNNLITSEEVETARKNATNAYSLNKITVGPNPNNGNFWFTVSGIENQTTASLYALDGKLIRQFRVMNMQQQRVNNLSNGVYLLKVPGMEVIKVIVQGSSQSASAAPASVELNQ
jgi:hypothetical protein